MGVHWGKLRTLLEKKIGHREETSAQPPAKNSPPDSESLSRKDLLERIDPNLIRSLSDRRVERMHPEILIVEDDPFSEKLVSNALKTNYSLSSTKDGQGAILSYVNKAPDVMFLDIGLPDITGHQVLEKIFDLDPTAYVVMFSGNGDRDNIMRAIELGAKGFVGKPFSKDKLVQYIEKSPFIQAKTREKSHEHRIH